MVSGAACPEEVEQVGVGRAKKLTAEQRSRIEAAVQLTEKRTGLEVLVYAGKAKGDPNSLARKLMAERGYATIPGVAIIVAPNQHRVEIVTSDQARERLSDEACARAIEIMLPAFRNGDWMAGLELGLAAITEEAGEGVDHGGEELPDLLE